MMDTLTRWKAARLLGQINASMIAEKDFSLSGEQGGILRHWLDAVGLAQRLGEVDLALAREIRRKIQ